MKHYLLLTALSLFSLATTVHAVPRINLAPAYSQLQEVQAEMQSMEGTIAPLLNQFKQQEELYQQSQCTNNPTDPGCIALKQQARQTYLSFLEKLDHELTTLKPGMEKAIKKLKPEMHKISHAMTASQLHDRVVLAVTPKRVNSQTQRVKNKKEANNGLIKKLGDFANSLGGANAAMQSKLEMRLAELYGQSTSIIKSIDFIQEIISSQKPMLQSGFADIFSDEMILQVSSMRQFVLGEDAPSSLPVTIDGDGESTANDQPYYDDPAFL